MDPPLLALTRPGIGLTPPSAATDSMRQLIQLRWLAVGGQLVTILAVHRALGVPLPLRAMLGVVALLALANLLATVALPRHRVTDGEVLGALLLDMGALTAQLYLSGGAANPFVSFYFLQLVLGAILLQRRSVALLLAVATLCFAGLSLRSVPLAYPPRLQAEIGDLQRLGTWISFALTGSLLGLFVTRITRNLGARDRYLADLRQRAAEEDGIVRMGLFASGAAHELGTPLATLSVILGDWRRVPAIAGDPDLRAELDDMRSEVARCKEIVTTILHSAGEPRGEAMARLPVASFLADVAAEWRPTHPQVPLNLACDAGDARLIADPALRQAVWSLLDNAAEVSPGGIALTGAQSPEGPVLTVCDAGPGFTPAQLANLGQPYQSGKGAGHGLGLFLAANVARRLGGRLEASNRPEGGAAVRLVLPAAPDPPKAR